MEEKVNLKTGLTDSMVKERIDKGLVNFNTQPVTKTIPEIIRSNVLTFLTF